MFLLQKIKKFGLLVTIFISVLSLLAAHTFAFSNLDQRSLSINSSLGGVTTNHTFSFHFLQNINVGSIVFQYCDDPLYDVPCNAPPGVNTGSAVLSSQTGETGFAIVSSAANQITLGRTPAIVNLAQNTYSFDNVVNPSNKGPFFVRISAYASSDGSGSMLAFSAVAGSITQGININSEVPDILYFCAAVIIPTDCSDASGDFIEFGILSPTATRFGSSQFLVGTNAVNGYTVSAAGGTMTSGNAAIPAITVPDISRIGTSQFGINLRANTVPFVGTDLVGGSGAVAPNYNQVDHYVYHDGDILATASSRSENGLYTVSYIVNIKDTQQGGVYNTTITYVCTASF